MRTLIILFTALLIPLIARENPFKPLIDETVLPVTSNQIEKKPPFEKATIQLPVDARVLTTVVVYYQSIDGSVKKEELSIDKAIDWHRPLLITQAPSPKVRTSNPPTSQVKPSKTPSKNQTPTHSRRTPKNDAWHRFAPLPFVEVQWMDHKVHIVTKDPKIRAFHINPPFKIALDFKRNARFLTRHQAVSTPPFKAIDIGNHRGYYRVVVTFDAPYRYTIEKTDDGYLIKLR